MSVDALSTESSVGSFFSGAAAMTVTGLSNTARAAQLCLKGALSGATSVVNGTYSAVKTGFVISASLGSAYPTTTKVALSAIALVGAAFVARCYGPALSELPMAARLMSLFTKK